MIPWHVLLGVIVVLSGFSWLLVWLGVNYPIVGGVITSLLLLTIITRISFMGFLLDWYTNRWFFWVRVAVMVMLMAVWVAMGWSTEYIRLPAGAVLPWLLAYFVRWLDLGPWMTKQLQR
jgi:uncharacterized membrane protein